jgi:hypothetical protein
MREDHYNLLEKVERKTGKALPQVDDMSAGCLVVNVHPVRGTLLLLSKSVSGNWGLPKGDVELANIYCNPSPGLFLCVCIKVTQILESQMLKRH